MEQETKCYCGHTTYCDCGPLEEPKQETLEEAAERNHNEQKLNTYTPYTFNDAFKDGAKWQDERMYSEEEVLSLILKFNDDKPGGFDASGWFEQIKKK